ncbi:hypothetical protein RND81_02G033900 [Saponaria officinalis]|uniref:Transmembrane protein n=1 Tax=Saponaria officinalis TaxID=3572 RepID=A0AAW1MQ31_SAPOF
MEDEHKQKPSHFSFINHHHHHNNDISIFPPINHEDLPIPPPPPPPLPPRAPLTTDSDDHSSPKKRKNYAHLINWVNFSLHFWNSKLLSFLTHLPSIGFFSSFRFVAATASFLGFVWFWVRRRRRNRVSGGGSGGGGGEVSVEHLKALIKTKDEVLFCFF